MNVHIEIMKEMMALPVKVKSVVQGDYVYLYLNHKLITMRTPQAYQVGLALGKTISKLEPQEMICIVVNNEAVPLKLNEVKLIISHLLLKAERIDTRQLEGVNYGRR